MKRSSRSNRRDGQSRLWNTIGRGLKKLTRAGAIAEAAGASAPTFEQLEERQLLFSLTVDPSNPTFTPGPGGTGTVFSTFAYFIPYLAPTVAVQPNQNQTVVLEDFNSPDPQNPGNFPNTVPINNNFIFDQSGLQVNYSATSLGLQQEPGQQAGGTNNRVIAGMQDGQQITFQVPVGIFNTPLSTFTIDLGPNFDPNNFTVDLLLQGNTQGSFTGNALAALGVPVQPVGTNQYRFTGTTFDQVRIRANSGVAATTFTIDNVSFTATLNQFAPILDSRVFGVRAVLSGPIGASAQFLDLYGREMAETIAIGIVPNSQPPFVIFDPDGNGVPNGNDGIGRVNLTGTDKTTSFTMWGGTITTTGNAFVFNLTADPAGNDDDLEGGGFGFVATLVSPGPPSPTYNVTGLPPAGDSLIIGSPYVRDNTSTATYGPTSVAGGGISFTRSNQGIFVFGGNISSVYIHGVIHGSSQFTGFVDRFVTGTLLGSVSVAGDMGTLMVGTDAGMWVDDDGAPGPVVTGSQLTVGRTLGQFVVAGRSATSVNVIGDLNNPVTRPARDAFHYFENEFSPGIPVNNQVDTTVAALLNNNNAAVFNHLFLPVGRTDQALAFGGVYYRNDTILGAEWIGSAATAVEIRGQLGFADPVNTREDPSDLYAFAVDGTRDVIVRLNLESAPLIGDGYMRLVDQDGRTLAAVQSGTGGGRGISEIRYRPNGPGVIYLDVQSSDNGAGAVTNRSYVVTVSGMAPSTFGAYQTGAGMTGTNVSVLSGSMGSFRIGTAYVDGTGAEVDPSGVYNPVAGQGLDAQMDFRAITASVAGNLYNITTGSDMVGPDITVGGNLGNIVTGLSGVVGTGFTQGDFRNTRLTVGGSIGFIDVRGGLGINNDATPIGVDLPNTVVIKTGQNVTMRGDIGLFRVGGDMGADTLSIRTPNGSTMGGLLISQDGTGGGDNSGIWQYQGLGNGEDIRLGTNSDLRFLDVPRIDLNNFENVAITLAAGQSQLLTDDGGGQVRVSIVGGDGTDTAVIRVLPIAGSLGAVISRIEVNLTGGGSLQITSLATNPSSAVVSIGHIVVTGSIAESSISITGPTQIDVYRITQVAGNEFTSVQNTTPGGDLVAVDLAALGGLTIASGDLGQTQMPAWGPQHIGPFLGVVAGGGQAGGGAPIGVTAAAIDANWNGNTFRPVNDSVNGNNSYLDDVGSPVSGYLNGLLVRTGNVNTISVGGAIGDVIANDPAAGEITNIIANSGGLIDPNRFRGIIGSVYATRISRIDVGDGLAAPNQAPLANTGIYADNDIDTVVGGRVAGVVIRGSVVAANDNNNDPVAYPTNGLNAVTLTNGASMVGAFIGATNLDAFWTSFWAQDGAVFPGTINRITTVGGNILRSDVWAGTINTITLTDGFWDASGLRSQGNTGVVTASGYRNSTVGGGELELHPNVMTIGGNLGTLTTTGMTGDIEDLTVAVFGSANEISARNLVRVKTDVVQGYVLLHTTDSIRSSSISGGALTTATIGKSILASEILIAGPLVSITAADSMINTRIVISGPDGRLGTLHATNLFTGSITTVGQTGTIEVTNGDLRGTITTLTSLRGVPGDITMLSSAGDLDVSTNIDGSVGTIQAGINLGNIQRPGVVFVKGGITTISVPNGQIYSDIRGGTTITTVTIGRALNFPAVSFLGHGSIIAFGHIETVNITGDFAGKIISYSGGIGVVTIDDGSLLPGAAIQAFDGNLNNVVINRGNLYGDIHADYILFSVRLNGSDDGVFGDIGINPAFNQGEAYDSFRNKLPPGVAPQPTVQGPRITAGQNIGRIVLTNGTIFEGFIFATRALGTVDVTGDIRNDNVTSGTGSVIAAGSSMFLVHATGDIQNAAILAGVRSFGADNRPGGTGADADDIQSGRLTTVQIDGSGSNVLVNAGITPGADGLYNTGDETVGMGISFVRAVTVGGSVSNVVVLADSPTLTVSPGVVRAGTAFPLQDPDLSNGDPGVGAIQIANGGTLNFNWGGVPGSISFSTDKGQAFWNPASGQVTLVNTSLNTQLVVRANATLTDFRIVSNDDASMGLIEVDTGLAGNSKIVVDAYVVKIQTGNITHADIRVGANVRNVTTGSFLGGSIRAALWARDIIINGDYGDPNAFDEATISALAGGTVTITGNDGGLINYDRDLVSLTVGGAMDKAQFRAGNTLGSLSANSASQTRVSAGDSIGTIAIAGGVDQTTFQAGGDLGSDAAAGGTGEAADSVSTGFIGAVTIGGDFTRSSLVAGQLRGPDGFFGTDDDDLGPGRSTIGNVTIAGTQVGSNLNTQQFRISATGGVGTVMIGGAPATNVGNFKVETLQPKANPLPIEVVDVQSTSDAQVWTTRLFFNQVMNVSTIGAALTVSEVRDSGNTLIPLVQGVDYVLTDFDAATNSIGIQYSRTVTDRDLPQAPGVAGPGVFRIQLEASVLRAAVDSARLDGNGNGFAVDDEDFSKDDVVGDAGDKLISETDFVDPITGQIVAQGTPGAVQVDFYGPADLDLVLDNNQTSDGLPDVNTSYTVRGVIGDHPDADVNVFPFPADTDIYKVTLRAGQILRLGAMQGAARFVGRQLLNDAGVAQGGNTADTEALPVNPLSVVDDTFPEDFLIKRTGTYFILINTLTDISPGVVPTAASGANTVGDYRFSLQVFDDADSGFAGDTDSGNGANVVNAPPAILFAGNDGVFGTGDDRATVPIGDFTFTLDAGPDGTPGTPDDVVNGSNGKGIISSRSNGTTLVSTIDSAIGPAGHAGVPGEVTSDVDVYKLNNGQPIAAGKRITIKIRLAELGADLGGLSQLNTTDFSGDVQFGVFDVTDATSVDDGLLVFSPTDFKPVAGKAQTIAQRGDVSYGYDTDGNFFITFVTPGKIGGTPNEAAVYALYLQGVFNTDYRIEVTQSEAPTAFAVPHSSQNVFLETRGGTIDWLEAGGLTSKLSSFAGSVLGFTGSISGLPVDQYILTNLVSTLQTMANSQGLALNFSTNPTAFEFQNFSTVFLTASDDPSTILGTTNFGYSQHSDPFNADPNDEAAVFLPSMSVLGYTSSKVDVDNFVLSLAAAVGRRVGELTGLRITADSGFGDDPVDIMSANSVFNPPGAGASYAFINGARPLSDNFDTVVNSNFFLGQQNAFALLSKFLAP